MNQAPTATPIEVNVMSNQLSHAALVTLRLAEQGITVLAAIANGRRPVLCVDRMPEHLPYVTKRSHPNGWGGTTVIDAAEYHGCQLECMRDVPGSWPGHTGRSHLQAVPNG